jgi:hypothetical protein
VNDEEFARTAFKHARETGFAGEPATTYDISAVRAQARRDVRLKQGVYTASTVALAGVVTAGVVAGPGILGFGSGAPQVSTAGSGAGSAGGTATTQPPASAGASSKSGTGVVATPCTNPPQVDWASLIKAEVPGATITLNPKFGATGGSSCVLLANGSMDVEALLTIGQPDGVVQIDVNTGGGKDGAAPSSTPDASLLQEKQELKREMASKATGAAASAKSAYATITGAAASKLAAVESGSTQPIEAPSPPVCSSANAGAQLCSQQVTKGAYVGLTVTLTRTSPTPLFVQVIGSTSAPGQAGQTPPLTSDQLTRIAEAVAEHF